MKKIAGYLFLFFLTTQAVAQTPPDTCGLRISLLTCSAGADLYSIFGHTGIRVIDSARNADVVFNYGTFDDSDPYFYLKFTRGIMRYSLSVWPFPEFMQEYKEERRGVIEQVLQLNCNEKKRLVNALLDNAQENHRYYDYRFHTDNCTTRSRDIVRKCTDSIVLFGSTMSLIPSDSSFRQLIHNSLNQGGQYWNKFAIDLLLGAHLDATATSEQAMFLPDYLRIGFAEATTGGRRLVKQTIQLLPAAPLQKADTWFTPMTFFLTLLIIGIVLSSMTGRVAARMLYVFDITLFLVTGLMGILICTLWIARVDTVCRNNWNIIWALPTHAVMAFMLRKRRQWIHVYWQLVKVLLFGLFVCWGWPQAMNNALIPLIILLFIRSIDKAGSSTPLKEESDPRPPKEEPAKPPAPEGELASR